MDRVVDRIDCSWFRLASRLGAIALAVSFAVSSARGQLVTRIDAIPRTGKLPVVFLNGYQRTCAGSSFRGTFDTADQVLQRDGRASLFFDNCAFANHPPIEELGNEFGKFLTGLRYEGGEPVAQVDIVAHSMGGLIVRSYLAGKQTQEGVFTPPMDTKLRKIIFLGTPHFGSPATSLLIGLAGSGDAQTAELEPGSRFVFDLGTWNQGIDDLRGADAISVVGNTANGFLTMRAMFGDGVTTLTSGSLGFVSPGRTRIVSYCHTDIASLICSGSRGNIAQINSADHDSARILLSFLNDTPDWRSIGESPEQNTFLSRGSGLLLRYRTANDQPQVFDRAASPQLNLSIPAPSLVFSDYASADAPLALTLTLPNNVTAALSVPLVAGSTRAVTSKTGPLINAIFPSASALFPRSVAPGSLISIYGNQLTTGAGETEVTVAGQRMPLTFAGPTQINTSAPESVSGLVKVMVKNSAGEHTVNLLVEPVAPALFVPALNALTGSLVTTMAPLRAGDYVALFLTGLGSTRAQDGLHWAVVQPEVNFGGRPCAVTFAGRAPGFPGLDQINCMIALDVQPSDAAPVFVRSAGRTSNVTTLPVR